MSKAKKIVAITPAAKAWVTRRQNAKKPALTAAQKAWQTRRANAK